MGDQGLLMALEDADEKQHRESTSVLPGHTAGGGRGSTYTQDLRWCPCALMVWGYEIGNMEEAAEIPVETSEVGRAQT